jgi:hypothetical protein
VNLIYSIQGQILGFYVLGSEALVLVKEGSIRKMKSLKEGETMSIGEQKPLFSWD